MGEPFQFVSDVYAEDLEAFLLRNCGLIDVNRGMLPLPIHEVHDLLICFVDVE